MPSSGAVILSPQRGTVTQADPPREEDGEKDMDTEKRRPDPEWERQSGGLRAQEQGTGMGCRDTPSKAQVASG